VCPPSILSLRDRLAKRGTENVKSMTTRLTNSFSEIQQGFELEGTFQYRVINDDLDISTGVFFKLVDTLYASELKA
jgi:guanylate kinase